VPLMGPPTADNPFPLRRCDPTCRLRGWRHLAAAVDEERAKLQLQEGVDPVLTGTGWSLPGEIGFYCQGHPTVHSLGLALGDRRSQYDFWGPHPILNPEDFRGRTFLLVAPNDFRPQSAFESIAVAQVVTHMEGGQPVARWTILVCKGYKGFGIKWGDHCY